jgi:hypothetical protein
MSMYLLAPTLPYIMLTYHIKAEACILDAARQTVFVPRYDFIHHRTRASAIVTPSFLPQLSLPAVARCPLFSPSQRFWWPAEAVVTLHLLRNRPNATWGAPLG